MEYEVVYIVCTLLESFVIRMLMQSFFKECKVNFIKEMTAYLVYGMINIAVYFLIDIPAVNMIKSLLGLFILTYLYEETFRKRFFMTLLLFMILGGTETAVAVATGYTEKLILEGGEYNSIIGLVVMRIITFIIAYIIRKVAKKDTEEFMPVKYWIGILTIPIITIYEFVLIYSKEEFRKSMLVPSMILAIVANLVIFYLYEQLISAMKAKVEKSVLENQNQYYEKQLDIIKQSDEQIRSVRHDMKNHLFSMKTFIENDEMEKLKKYVENCEHSLDNNERYVASGNTIIDSILNYKLYVAEQHNIGISAYAKVEDAISLTPFELTVILGNLLDNAIEGCMQIEKDRRIDVEISCQQNSLLVYVENTYGGDVKKEKGQIMTTKSDEKSHGLGIKNIQKIVNEKQGTMEITHNSKKFDVDISIPI